MKGFIFLILFTCFTGMIYSNPTDAEIQQAATILGVPFSELKQFVQSFQSRNIPSGIVQIDAGQLYQEFRNNALRADNQYKGKMLQITGRIHEIKPDAFGNYVVDLNGYEQVRIYFIAEELNKIAYLEPGQIITIIGKCDGLQYSVRLIISDAYLII